MIETEYVLKNTESGEEIVINGIQAILFKVIRKELDKQREELYPTVV